MDGPPVGRPGTIVSGPEAGRVMEVVDDAHGSGGFPIGPSDRSGEALDTWFEDYGQVREAFAETGWVVEWT